MAKFAKILGLLGLGSDKEAVTEAHLEAADTKIAQLEQAKTEAEQQAEKAAADLKTAQDAKAKADTDLANTQTKLATLEKWKNENKATDQRDEDDSNKLDGQPEAQESWEKVAASTIASTKKRLGEK